MKDRIKRIMDTQHMTQQVFAQFIKISPATLSGIFNGRTNPSLNIVEAIKQSLPSISTDWLLFGRGPMYIDDTSADQMDGSTPPVDVQEQAIDFDVPSTTPQIAPSSAAFRQSVPTTPNNREHLYLKNIDKKPRQITEIRIFFDDQTWESFVPKK